MLRSRSTVLFVVILATLLQWNLAWAQHEHGATEVKAPRIFLDKSPRIVAYQLQRLSNQQLLAVETRTDDKKYLPVFEAILTREGMSTAYRQQALQAMVAVNQSDAVTELVKSLMSIESSDAAAEQTRLALASILLSQEQGQLKQHLAELKQLCGQEKMDIAAVGFAALITANSPELAWEFAIDSDSVQACVESIPLLAEASARNALQSQLLDLALQGKPEMRRSALAGLATVTRPEPQLFAKLSDLVDQPEVRDAAVRALLAVPKDVRDDETRLKLLKFLVTFAEESPAEQRTTNSFLDAMELCEQLLAAAPSEIAKEYRQRLRETVVRVIRIHTVEEEMRYDLPYFAVEAGRPVQIVLINEDLMPHNLVVTQPGALKQVAEEGLLVGPTGGMDGKQYVPHSDLVLHATRMVASLDQERLTFTAPEVPGEYPYVCTFPRHWMRMYGVMVVVEDLDAWLKNPVEPKDPVGSNRSFVQAWTVNDFETGIDQALRGRTREIGERIFTEATCAQCHKLGQAGVGTVGPDLAKVFSKYKGDARTVLQEILDPSHRIDDRYAVHKILDADDQVLTGLLVSEDQDAVRILTDPEAKQPTEILKDDIVTMVKTANSMMPKGLMDRFSQDEIYELLSYLRESQVAE